MAEELEPTRKERMARKLEEQLDCCDEMAAKIYQYVSNSRDDVPSLNMLKSMAALSRVSAQLACTVIRLEASENRGSIPQES